MHTLQDTVCSGAHQLTHCWCSGACRGKARGRSHLLPQGCQTSSCRYSPICCDSTCYITFSRRHLSSFQLVVTWAALPGQSPPNIPPAQLKYQGGGREKEGVSHHQHPQQDSHSMYWMLPWQLFWPKASLVLFAKQKQGGCAHTHSPGQPAGPSTLVHSRQCATGPLQTATHHLPHPEVKCCESQCLHLLLTVPAWRASLQKTGIIAFHLQEDKHIKPSERLRYCTDQSQSKYQNWDCKRYNRSKRQLKG